MLVGGEPGAGKTRLAAEVAGRAARAGRRRAGGHGDEGRRGALPAVRRDAGPPVPDERAGHAGRRRRSSACCPGTPHRHLPTPAEPVGDGRRDLFEAVADACSGRLAQDRPLVVVLDDLHWAQLPTVALLEHVVHSCLDTPTLVVATFRTTAPDRSDELSARLADLHRLDGVRRLDLAGLDTDAIAEFVGEHAGVSRPRRGPSAAILRDRTGGNPFFLRETWLDLERHGGVAALRGPQRRARHPRRHRGAPGWPASVRRVRETIDLAAVIGDDVRPRRRWSARAAPTGATSMDAVDAATAVGLIEAVAEPPGRYGFVHSLTRQVVAGPAAAHPLHGAARPRGADAWRPHGDPALAPAYRPPLPRRSRARLPRAGIAARTRRGRPAGRAQPGVRGGGAVVRPGRGPARDARRTSARAVVRGRGRTTCGLGTSPGPGRSTSG